MKWEYSIFVFQYIPSKDDKIKWSGRLDDQKIVTENLNEILDQKGNEGWEAVNMDPIEFLKKKKTATSNAFIILFKRPRIDHSTKK